MNFCNIKIQCIKHYNIYMQIQNALFSSHSRTGPSPLTLPLIYANPVEPDDNALHLYIHLHKLHNSQIPHLWDRCMVWRGGTHLPYIVSHSAFGNSFLCSREGQLIANDKDCTYVCNSHAHLCVTTHTVHCTICRHYCKYFYSPIAGLLSTL